MKRLAMLAFAALMATSSQAAAQQKTIVQTAQDDGHFTTLLKLTKMAGMDKALMGPGPFTVFAPTDAAFAALPPGMLDMLQKPENKQMLGMVLGYHVLAGRLSTPDVMKVANGPTKAAATALIGAPLVFASANGALMVNDAHVTQDVPTSNGIVHVVDKVLVPPMPIQPKL